MSKKRKPTLQNGVFHLTCPKEDERKLGGQSPVLYNFGNHNPTPNKGKYLHNDAENFFYSLNGSRTGNVRFISMADMKNVVVKSHISPVVDLGVIIPGSMYASLSEDNIIMLWRIKRVKVAPKPDDGKKKKKKKKKKPGTKLEYEVVCRLKSTGKLSILTVLQKFGLIFVADNTKHCIYSIHIRTAVNYFSHYIKVYAKESVTYHIPLLSLDEAEYNQQVPFPTGVHKIHYELRGITCMNGTEDNQYLAVGLRSGYVYVFDIANNFNCLRGWQVEEHPISALKFLDNKNLIVGYEDNAKFTIWELVSELKTTLSSFVQITRNVADVQDNVPMVNCYDITPCGKFIVAANSNSTTLYIIRIYKKGRSYRFCQILFEYDTKETVLQISCIPIRTYGNVEAMGFFLRKRQSIYLASIRLKNVLVTRADELRKLETERAKERVNRQMNFRLAGMRSRHFVEWDFYYALVSGKEKMFKYYLALSLHDSEYYHKLREKGYDRFILTKVMIDEMLQKYVLNAPMDQTKFYEKFSFSTLRILKRFFPSFQKNCPGFLTTFFTKYCENIATEGPALLLDYSKHQYFKLGERVVSPSYENCVGIMLNGLPKWALGVQQQKKIYCATQYCMAQKEFEFVMNKPKIDKRIVDYCSTQNEILMEIWKKLLGWVGVFSEYKNREKMMRVIVCGFKKLRDEELESVLSSEDNSVRMGFQVKLNRLVQAYNLASAGVMGTYAKVEKVTESQEFSEVMNKNRERFNREKEKFCVEMLKLVKTFPTADNVHMKFQALFFGDVEKLHGKFIKFLSNAQKIQKAFNSLKGRHLMTVRAMKILTEKIKMTSDKVTKISI